MTYFVEGFLPDGPGIWTTADTFAAALAVAFLWLSTARAVRVTVRNLEGAIAAAAWGQSPRVPAGNPGGSVSESASRAFESRREASRADGRLRVPTPWREI